MYGNCTGSALRKGANYLYRSEIITTKKVIMYVYFVILDYINSHFQMDFYLMFLLCISAVIY
jgi:hypothetical protein